MLENQIKMNSTLYLDHHSTTPMAPEVLQAMLPYFTEHFGNPASQNHPYGWEAQHAVETARSQVASLLGAHPREIVFTSGATESNSLAILGVFGRSTAANNHFVTSNIEHSSILELIPRLEKMGVEVTQLDVDPLGRISKDQVLQALRPDTRLVSLIHGNNEVGSLNPVAEIAEALQKAGVLFHVDAVQSLGRVPIDLTTMKIDLLSLSGHKIYGPKGVGALYIRKRQPQIRLAPLFGGGGQERGVRSGTLNVPGIVGLGAACTLMQHEISHEPNRQTQLRDQFIHEVCATLEGVQLNGHPTERLCHNVSLTFHNFSGKSLMPHLLKIAAVSQGSACSSNNMSPSHVLKAIGLTDQEAALTVRFGLGRPTTWTDLEKVIGSLKEIR